jgi:hypothetical protein
MKKTEAPATDAATIVASLESLPLGAAVAAAMMAAAAQKVAAQSAAADEALFDGASLSADASAFLALQRIESSAPGGLEYGAFMSSWHARALRAHVPLAGLIRALCLADVARHAARHAAVLARPEHEVAAEAVSTFKIEIARQLVEHRDLGAAARALLAAEDLARRVAAVRAQHEAHAEEERQRAEEERQAAERRELDEQVAASLRADEEAVAARSRLLSAEERARLTAALALKARLLKTSCKRLVIGRQVYDPKTVAGTILECSDVQVRAFGGALDYAEQAQAS